jgi:hypothetical protein
MIPGSGGTQRALRLIGLEPWGREQWERLGEGLTFDGMESWLPWLTDGEHVLARDGRVARPELAKGGRPVAAQHGVVLRLELGLFPGDPRLPVVGQRCERTDHDEVRFLPVRREVLGDEMFGRIRSLPGGPMAETFEAYRNRILSYLGDEDPIRVQKATPTQLEGRLRDVAPEELIRRPAPEKWSIAEIVAHLADAELAMGWRLRNILANPGVALTWWDEAAWAERLGYVQQDASVSAGVFRALRESNLRLLESIPRARWVEYYGVHEVRGRQTVEEFVRMEAAHDLNHLRQIDRILDGCMGGQS